MTGSKDTSAPGKFAPNSTMANIQKRGQLIVGVVDNRAPFSSINPNTGSWTGFDIEITKQIAVRIFGSQIEGKIRWIPLDPRDRELALEQGRVDMALGRYAITVPRKRFVDFAGPYYVAYQEAVVGVDRQTNLNINALVDLNGKKLCIVTGSTNVEAVKATVPAADLSVEKATVQECAAAVIGGEVQGMVADHVDLLAVTGGGARTLRTLKTQFGQEPYGIGTKKNVLDFRQFLNDLLDNQIRDTYSATYSRTVPGDRVGQPPVDRY